MTDTDVQQVSAEHHSLVLPALFLWCLQGNRQCLPAALHASPAVPQHPSPPETQWCWLYHAIGSVGRRHDKGIILFSQGNGHDWLTGEMCFRQRICRDEIMSASVRETNSRINQRNGLTRWLKRPFIQRLVTMFGCVFGEMRTFVNEKAGNEATSIQIIFEVIWKSDVFLLWTSQKKVSDEFNSW